MQSLSFTQNITETSGKLVEKQVDEYCTASDRYEST